MTEEALLILADVALDCPGRDAFSYLVPEELRPKLQVGDAVQVPFGRRVQQGFVIAIREAPKPEYTVRPIEKRLDHVHLPAPLIRLIRWAASYYRCSLGTFLSAAVPTAVRDATALKKLRFIRKDEAFDGKLTKRQQQVWEQLPIEQITFADGCKKTGCSAGVLDRLIESGAVSLTVDDSVQEHVLNVAQENHALTDEQQVAFDAVSARLDDGGNETFMLYGVTGSGKTLVYMDLVDQVIAAGQQTLLLLPEIALTPQLAARFRGRFERVVVWHSQFTAGERHKQWQDVRAGKVDLVIGTRSALFAPLTNIGLIIVDEEHEHSYKQDSTPRYQGRDLAIMYGVQCDVPVVLGSATPSCETIKNARDGKFSVLTLRKRPAGGSLPTPIVVDMREECQEQKKQVTVSRALIEHITRAKKRGKQSIVLLNRRGWSPIVHCASCGHSLSCEACDVSLTWHKGPQLLRCHYCGHEGGLPKVCPACSQPALTTKGMGTEQLCHALSKEIEGLRVLRLDADTVSKRQGHAQLLSAFGDREYDCLVGTQMVAKGLNFPNVTVVGVVAADHGLAQPDFRAAERTFQLIAQVAGRAGRGKDAGTVIVQAFDPEAPALFCALRIKPKTFYNGELELRERYGYPPYTGLIRIVWRGEKLQEVESLALEQGQRLQACAENLPILGPGPAGIAFLKGQHRWHALIKAGSRGAAQAFLARLHEAGGLPERRGVKIMTDVDPYAFS